MTNNEIRSEIRQIQRRLFILSRSVNDRRKKDYNQAVSVRVAKQLTKADDSLDDAIRIIDLWK